MAVEMTVEEFLRATDPQTPPPATYTPGEEVLDTVPRTVVDTDDYFSPSDVPRNAWPTMDPFKPLRSFGGSLIEGIGDTGAGAVESAAIAMDLSLKAVGKQDASYDVLDAGLEYGETIRQISAVDPDSLMEGFFTREFPRALGQSIGFMAGGLVTAPARVAAWVAPAVLGYALGGSEGFRDARANGATEEEAYASWALNGVVGTSEAWAINKLFNRIDKVSGGAASRNITQKLFEKIGKPNLDLQVGAFMPAWKQAAVLGRETVAGAIEEGMQELFQQTAGNVIAKTLYDPTRSITENALDAAELGASTGSLLSLGFSALGLRLRGVRTTESFLKPAVEREALTQEEADTIRKSGLTLSTDFVDLVNLRKDLEQSITKTAELNVRKELTEGENANLNKYLEALDTEALPLEPGEQGIGPEQTLLRNLRKEFFTDQDGNLISPIEALQNDNFLMGAKWKALRLVADNEKAVDSTVEETPVGARMRWKGEVEADLTFRLESVLRRLMPMLQNADGVQPKLILSAKTKGATDLGSAEYNELEMTEGGRPTPVYMISLNAELFESELNDILADGEISEKDFKREAAAVVAQYADTAVHEFTHTLVRRKIAEFRALALNTPEGSRQQKLYEGLYQAYLRDLAQDNMNLPANEFMAARAEYSGRNLSDIEKAYTIARKGGFKSAQDLAYMISGQRGKAGHPRMVLSKEDWKYYNSFDEWLVRQITRGFAERGGLSNLLGEETSSQVIAMLETVYGEARRLGVGTAQQKTPYEFFRLMDTDWQFSKAMQAVAKGIAPDPILALTRNDVEGSGGDTGAPRLNIPNDEWNTELDTWNQVYRYGANLLQIAAVNEHIRPLQGYVGRMKEWSNYRNSKALRAQEVHRKWMRLGKERAAKLNRALLDETIDQKFLDEAQLRERGFDEEMLGIRAEIQKDFADLLGDMEQTLVDDAKRRFGTDAFAQAKAVAEIRKNFGELRKKPYFPLMRFGKYAVTVRDAQGNMVHFETHESVREQKRAQENWIRRIKTNANGQLQGHKATVGELSDFQRIVQSLPKDFAAAIISKFETLDPNMKLSEEQKKVLLELAHENSQPKGFMKQFVRRKRVPGYSEDALRAYASYMSSASNYIARYRYAPKMAEDIADIKAQALHISKKYSGEFGELSSRSKRDQIANWMDRHLAYVMNPSNELAALRSGVFTWFLGFNPKSAALNATQIVYTTIPYLGARFEGSAAIAVNKAVGKLSKRWVKGELNDKNLEELLGRGLAEGWLDESLATDLAVATRTDRIDRMLPIQKGRLALQKIPQYSAVMFHAVEKMNRQVTAVAAYEMAKNQGLSHEASILEARRAVERTQFEYERWNRPEFMRGKKSIAFVFMNYVQNMVFFALKEQGARRFWMMQLVLAGAMGLPGMDDLLDLFDASWNTLGRRMGFKKPYMDSRHEIRAMANDLLEDMWINPDIVLHGLSQSTFGLANIPLFDRFPIPRVDMSGSLSMANIIPGTQGIREWANNPRANMNDVFARTAAELSGATGSAVYDVLNAASSNNPSIWKRVEKALPTAARNISKAARIASEGAEKSSDGTIIADFDMNDPRDVAEILAMAAGFQPRKLTKGWEGYVAAQEVARYYQGWSATLKSDWNWARHTGDREGQRDAYKAIVEFNRAVPFKTMIISTDSLNRSARGFDRTRSRGSLDLAQQNAYIQLQRSIRSEYAEPEEEDNVRIER